MQDNGPAAANGRVQGNFLPADVLAQDSGRAAGQGRRSYLPAGEAAMQYKTRGERTLLRRAVV